MGYANAYPKNRKRGLFLDITEPLKKKGGKLYLIIYFS